ncbi:MAG: hypothetical protein KAW12_12665 [Candidatus Aminicenantes bacterium]|nr:hypothetical protein [Candidatus Aminicenantes bacterium]
MKKIFVFAAVILVMTMGLFSKEVFKDINLGRIFVINKDGFMYSDIDSHTIGKYSPEGKLVLKMGRKGEGPGDIKRMGWFAISPKDGLIYVTEFAGGNKWVSKFTKNGKFVKEYNVEVDWRKIDGLSFNAIDEQGNTYIETTKNTFERYKEFSLGTVHRVLYKFSPEGKKLAEIYKFSGKFNADRGDKGNITIPFHNYLYWKLYKDVIIVREHHDDFVSIFNLDGSIKKKIHLPFKKEKLTKKDINRWGKIMRARPSMKEAIAKGWIDFNYWFKRLPYPDYKPVSGMQMFIDPEGYLLSCKYFGYERKNFRWARINLETGENTVIRTPDDEKLLYIDKDFYYFRKEVDDANYDEVLIKIPKDKLEVIHVGEKK